MSIEKLPINDVVRWLEKLLKYLEIEDYDRKKLCDCIDYLNSTLEENK